VIHRRRHPPFSRISKIANLKPSPIYENRDSVELVAFIFWDRAFSMGYGRLE
jgi:hypothetical protein